jgi:hypothetical protein
VAHVIAGAATSRQTADRPDGSALRFVPPWHLDVVTGSGELRGFTNFSYLAEDAEV